MINEPIFILKKISFQYRSKAITKELTQGRSNLLDLYNSNTAI